MVESCIVKIPRSIILCIGLLLAACMPARLATPGVATPGVTPATPTLTSAIQETPITASTSGANLPPARTNFPSCEPAASLLPFRIASAQALDHPTDAPSMRLLAKQNNFFIGAATDPGFLENDSAASQLLAREFNMLVPEVAMKWEIIHPEPERYDFSHGDALVTFARQHGMSVRGHVLVWDLQMPAWVTNGQFTRQEWMQILCTHIKSVVSHYRGQIYAWDVVNEAVNQDGTLRNTFWMDKLGPEHIAMAFQWAREADPTAKLFYNDNGGEGLNPKSQGIFALVQGLQQTGVPIDGVGMQMHTSLERAPTALELSTNMQRLAELGLEIHITEMDVRLQNSTSDNETKLAEQADIYRQVLSVCLSVPNCKAFLTWGLTDRYSWIPGFTGKPDAPLLFDMDGAPKPAYFAIVKLLANQ
jgi:endo-1,4-beta-xylanase